MPLVKYDAYVSRKILLYTTKFSSYYYFTDILFFNIICRLGKLDHKTGPQLWFHNTGLGAIDGVNDKKWTLKTFPTLLSENNHTQV